MSPARHVRPTCPRCQHTGDPRSCTCMREIRRRCSEAWDALRRGRPMLARQELAAAMRLLDLLGKDGVKAGRA